MSIDPKTSKHDTDPQDRSGNHSAPDAQSEKQAAVNSGETNQSTKPIGPSTTNSVEFVVGIGASAGGLQSIEKLLKGIKPGTNSALVIVQHFSPDVVSSMAEILDRSTDLKIVMAADGVPLEPDTIFLIPPGQEIRVSDNRFNLRDADRTQITRVVDALLESLAASRGSRAIGVILSGTGSDGSNGIKAIRNAGGTTLVESFDSAQFDGMPRNAVQTRCVDHIMSPSEIATWLSRQFANPYERASSGDPIEAEALTGIKLIFSLLSDRREVDFSAYKPSTVARRIERRQQICKKTTIQSYADFAKDNIEELDFLYHDLLIGVTKFFRDTDAFLSLERCLLELVKSIPDGEQLRIWSAGCATGEEPYSLAMLAYDAFTTLGRPPNFKVFATDIHQGSLDFASQGIYDNETMEYVSAERQATFFSQESATQSRVTNLLRRNMVFARHNVFGDPPFTNMHLVTCRNLLIYLKTDAQMRAISSFHFAMKVDGLMMLGSSETAGALATEFRQIDKGWRIFQKIANRPKPIKHLMGDKPNVAGRGPRQLVNILNRDRPESMSFTRLIECYDMILREHVPSGFLLDDNRNIVHTFGEAGKFLNSPTGRFSGNLTSMLNGNAKIAITSALIRSQQQLKQKIVLQGLEVAVGKGSETLNVQIRAFDSEEYDNTVAWLVEFIEPTASDIDSKPSLPVQVESASGSFDDLESELIYTRDSLNISIQQLESSNEELSAANEELVASNEELQSTNEELESVNEELYTVNLENKRRIDELKEVTDDLEVLLINSEVGTLFLDTNLCIRKFTQSITEYFDLLPHDIGRPINNFTNKSGIVDLDLKLEVALKTGKTFGDEIQDLVGRMVRYKLVPHIVDDEIAGVVLTISVQIDSASEGIKTGFWRWPDVDQDQMWWSDECFQLLGLSKEETQPAFSTLKSFVHPDDQHKFELTNPKNRQFADDGFLAIRLKINGNDEDYHRFSIHATAEKVVDGRPEGFVGSISLLT